MNTCPQLPKSSVRSTENSFLKLTLLGVLALLCTASTGLSDVIYRQVFENSSGEWQSFKALGIDWSSWLTIGNKEWYWKGMGVSPSASLSGTSENIGNATPAHTGSGANGKYVFSDGCISLYTTSLTLDPKYYPNIEFSWLQNNNLWKDDPDAQMVTSVRLLIRQEGVWYVSTQSFFFADKNTHAVQIAYSPEASNWLILSAGPHPYNSDYASISASPTSNLSGAITAFGVVAYTPKKYWIDIDDFSVSTTKVTRP